MRGIVATAPDYVRTLQNPQYFLQNLVIVILFYRIVIWSTPFFFPLLFRESGLRRFPKHVALKSVIGNRMPDRAQHLPISGTTVEANSTNRDKQRQQPVLEVIPAKKKVAKLVQVGIEQPLANTIGRLLRLVWLFRRTHGTIVAMSDRDSDDLYPDAEIVRRRELALKRMLNTPHQPHATAGRKRKRKAAKSRSSQAKTKSA